MIYLDYAATTPMSPKAIEVYSQVSAKYYGNASSLHDIGSNARQIKEASAKVIAGSLGVLAKDIWFTSGATESNALAIQALLDGRKDDRKQIITTEIEHSSVLNVFRRLEKEGWQVDWLKIDQTGKVDLNHLKELVSEQTALISVQHINSELGTIQPLKEIADIVKPFGVLFHSDCVQSFGKIPVDARELGVDSISISSHKIYGPKGVGAVWMSPDVEWGAYFTDPHQKKSLRFGTDNVPGMAAFAAAVKEIMVIRDSEFERISSFKKAFIDELRKLPYEFIIEGVENEASPYIMGVRFPGFEGQMFMLDCSQTGLAISTGSACQVGSDLPNRTMMTLGRTIEQAREFVRFSFGKDVKAELIDEIIPKIDTILSRHFNKVLRPAKNQ